MFAMDTICYKAGCSHCCKENNDDNYNVNMVNTKSVNSMDSIDNSKKVVKSKYQEYYDKYIKILSGYNINPSQDKLKKLRRLQTKIHRSRRIRINCEKVKNELCKRCNTKVCYIKCDRYYKEYMESLKKFRKENNNRTRRNLYSGYVRLDKCRRARIESSVGPDGWGSTPAMPTYDRRNGH